MFTMITTIIIIIIIATTITIIIVIHSHFDSSRPATTGQPRALGCDRSAA